MRTKTGSLCALALAILSASLSPCCGFEFASADLEQLKTIDPEVIRAEDDATLIDRYLDELHLAPELHLMLRRILPQYPHLDDSEKFASTISYDEKGRRALAESDPASAIRYFVKALQLDPASNETRDHLLTAFEHFELQQESAKASQEEIIKKEQALSRSRRGPYSEEATRRYNAAVEWHQAGYFDNATREYNTALQIEPGMAEAWSNLAGLQHAQRRLNGALHSVQHAFAYDSSRGFALREYGQILEARQDYEGAIRFYRRAIKCFVTDPEWVRPYRELAELLRRTGSPKEADEILKQIPRQTEPSEKNELNPPDSSRTYRGKRRQNIDH